MTRQQVQKKFDNLSDKQQSQVRREAGIIRECGANLFFIETGCHASAPKSWWTLVKWAMDSLSI